MRGGPAVELGVLRMKSQGRDAIIKASVLSHGNVKLTYI